MLLFNFVVMAAASLDGCRCILIKNDLSSHFILIWGVFSLRLIRNSKHTWVFFCLLLLDVWIACDAKKAPAQPLCLLGLFIYGSSYAKHVKMIDYLLLAVNYRPSSNATYFQFICCGKSIYICLQLKIVSKSMPSVWWFAQMKT